MKKGLLRGLVALAGCALDQGGIDQVHWMADYRGIGSKRAHWGELPNFCRDSQNVDMALTQNANGKA
jgi:hypothetical protein